MKYIGSYYIKDKKYFAKGAFSRIYLGYNKYSNYKVAIKQIKVEDTKKLKQHVRREIDLHGKLSHPNIINLHDVIADDFNNYIYLILEYCKLGDLSKFQNKRPINEIYMQNFVYQLKDALKYLKDKEIIHRDLKPQNLLINEGHILKLSDFGLAKELKKEDAEIDLKQTYCGSPMYMSPELIQHKKYNSNSDLWSIGVIIYEMITGEPPFKVKNYKQLIEKMKTEIKIPDKYKRNISNECCQLLESLLSIDSKYRITWDSFFEHPWLQSNKLIDFENQLIANPLDLDIVNKVHTIFVEDDVTLSIISSITRNNETSYNYYDTSNNNNNINNNNINNNNIENREDYKSRKDYKDNEDNENNKDNKDNEDNEDNEEDYEDNDVKLSMNDLINGLESDVEPENSYMSSTSIQINSDENYTTCSDDSSDANQLNSLYSSNTSSFTESIRKLTSQQKSYASNDIYNLNSNKFSLDSKLQNLENISHKRNSKLRHNLTTEYVKVDIDSGNQLSFTSSLISSLEKSKPINIVSDRNNKINKRDKRDKRDKNRKYDFHKEIANSVEERYKKSNLSPSKSSVENIFTSSLNIIKESYKYLSNNHKSL
jgi:serine/threonine protein kinase